jgi:hypothetical protein
MRHARPCTHSDQGYTLCMAALIYAWGHVPAERSISHKRRMAAHRNKRFYDMSAGLQAAGVHMSPPSERRRLCPLLPMLALPHILIPLPSPAGPAHHGHDGCGLLGQLGPVGRHAVLRGGTLHLHLRCVDAVPWARDRAAGAKRQRLGRENGGNSVVVWFQSGLPYPDRDGETRCLEPFWALPLPRPLPHRPPAGLILQFNMFLNNNYGLLFFLFFLFQLAMSSFAMFISAFVRKWVPHTFCPACVWGLHGCVPPTPPGPPDALAPSMTPIRPSAQRIEYIGRQVGRGGGLSRRLHVRGACVPPWSFPLVSPPPLPRSLAHAPASSSTHQPPASAYTSATSGFRWPPTSVFPSSSSAGSCRRSSSLACRTPPTFTSRSAVSSRPSFRCSRGTCWSRASWTLALPRLGTTQVRVLLGAGRGEGSPAGVDMPRQCIEGSARLHSACTYMLLSVAVLATCHSSQSANQSPLMLSVCAPHPGYNLQDTRCYGT